MRGLIVAAIAALPSAASAQEDQSTRLAIAERFLDCYEMKLDMEPEARLACYDDLAADIPEWVSGEPPTASVGCQIEDWTFEHTSAGTRIAGATTCPSGRLHYRLYTADGDFLNAGETFIRGFVFSDYSDLPGRPAQLGIRYSIAE